MVPSFSSTSGRQNEIRLRCIFACGLLKFKPRLHFTIFSQNSIYFYSFLQQQCFVSRFPKKTEIPL